MRRMVALCLCIAATARADGLYYTEAIGVTNVSDELRPYVATPLQPRLALGMRTGRWALEGWVSRAINVAQPDLVVTDATPNPARNPGYHHGPVDLLMYGIDLKYAEPVSAHLELYVRGRISAANGKGQLADWRGRGLGLGGGIQVKGKVSPWGLLFFPLYFLVKTGPMLTAAAYADFGDDFYRLHGPQPLAIDARLTTMTYGLALGADF